MNRGLYVTRQLPGLDELKMTARQICKDSMRDKVICENWVISVLSTVGSHCSETFISIYRRYVLWYAISHTLNLPNLLLECQLICQFGWNSITNASQFHINLFFLYFCSWYNIPAQQPVGKSGRSLHGDLRRLQPKRHQVLHWTTGLLLLGGWNLSFAFHISSRSIVSYPDLPDAIRMFLPQ